MINRKRPSLIPLTPVRRPKPWGEEIWLTSIHPDGPAGIAGKKTTLAEMFRRNPGLWGKSPRPQSVFVKFLRTKFPFRVHLGFKKRISPAELLSRLEKEQELLRRFRRILKISDRRAFNRYQNSYEGWAENRALDGWRRDARSVDQLASFLRPFFKTASGGAVPLLTNLADNRAALVDVLNEVDLTKEMGNGFLCPSGTVHSIFGLSLQVHPREGEEAKSEAWFPFKSHGKNALAEVQQSSNTTFSLADFFTPFTWKNGAAFRKGSPGGGLTRENLKKYLIHADLNPHPVSFFRRRPRRMKKGADLYRMVDSRKGWPYFNVYRLGVGARSLEAVGNPGGGPRQIVVARGRVSVRTEDGVKTNSTPHRPAFIPAETGRLFFLSKEKSEVFIVGIPGR